MKPARQIVVEKGLKILLRFLKETVGITTEMLGAASKQMSKNCLKC